VPIVNRPAEERDRDAVFALLQQFATSYTPERSAFDSHYPRLLSSDRDVLLVADAGDAVVGYVLASVALTLYANGPVTQIEELIVAPSRRGEGIGRALVEAVVERARAAGAMEVTVPTRRAGDYYLRLGFERTADYYRLRLGRQGR
jgi:predicted N-acetyltransferase YhbS